MGTLNILEAVRRFAKESPFVHLSTNKVYGDAPNRIALQELRDARTTPIRITQMEYAKTSTSTSQNTAYWRLQVGWRCNGSRVRSIFGMATCCCAVDVSPAHRIRASSCTAF